MQKTVVEILACLVVPLVWAQPQNVHPITGRQYAGAMGIEGAPWLVRSERER